MKGKILLIGLLVLAILLSGCITGELAETVRADGGLHRLVSLDKTGLLANGSCSSLKNMIAINPEATTYDLEHFDQICRETDSEIIVEFDLPYGDKLNPVKIIEREDGEYLVYEGDLSGLTTKIIMPSAITRHSGGKILTWNTIEFEAINAFDQTAAPKIYVESKKPEFDPLSPIIIIGAIIGIGAIIVFAYLLKKKRFK